jgi:uncharacterized protein (DUF849 family)
MLHWANETGVIIQHILYSQRIDWGLCAFGQGGTACLVRAVELWGKARVGFKNALWHANGSMAKDMRNGCGNSALR